MKKAPVLGPTLLSIFAHGVLVSLMFLNLSSDDKPKPLNRSASAAKPQIVETVSVDSKKVEELVKKIRKKKKKEADKQKALKKKLAALEKKRKKEERRSKKAAAKRKKDEALAKAAEKQRKQNEKLANEADADRKDKEEQAFLAQQQLALDQQQLEDVKEKREQEALNKIRQDELEQQMLEEESAFNEEHQQFILTEKEKYVALIRGKIYANLVSGVDAKVKIRLAPGGLVLEVNCIEGDSIACKAAMVAVEKSDPLPISRDPDVFSELRDIVLTLNKKIPGGL